MSTVIILFFYMPVFAWHLYKMCTSKSKEELDRAAISAFVGFGVLVFALIVGVTIESLFLGGYALFQIGQIR